MNPKPTPQVEKFRQLARELETDDDEARFDERLKKLAHAKSKPKAQPRAGHWRVDFALPHGQRANFYPVDPLLTFAPSPIFSTPHEVYRWLEGHGCKQRAGEPDIWDD